MGQRRMTVARLRAVLAGFPDGAPVLVPGDDHSFRPAEPDMLDVVWEEEARVWSEGEGSEFSEQKTLALVIR